MRKVVPKEGLRAPLFFTALLLLASFAEAQTVEQDEMRRCAVMQTDELRLDCFQALVSAEPQGVEVEEPQPDVPPAAKAPAAIAVPGTASADGKAPPGEEPALSPDVVAEPESSAESTMTTAPTAAPDTIGEEHLGQIEPPESEVYVASVEKVTRTNDRRLNFHFVNGQVWRQVDHSYFGYPKKEVFDVEISRGMMGDYQIRVAGEGRMTRIKRIQ